MSLFDRILAVRGIDSASKAAFLNPKYSSGHDPFLLPDMGKAVKRLVSALNSQEKITIYGDYDIDGLTASTLLQDALASFGYKNVEIFIPNRFVEGFGLTDDAVKRIAKTGTTLIVTVDCSSQSVKEVKSAKELGVDMIITDHHEPPDSLLNGLPAAVAVVNPKRSDSKYPFKDLAGVGVAFKLVQALQKEMNSSSSSTHSTSSGLAASSGLSFGQEKWLLDLVALGTVCDVVSLTDENRTFVYFGLKVLAQTKRPGLKALMAISRIEPSELNARALGFGLGPRMNAAGRLETAQHALDMLVEKDPMQALAKAELLELLNVARRADQDRIWREASSLVEKYSNDSVLVISGHDWNHGIVGIVASKLLETYRKPVFIFQEMGAESKGSARSYGDFSVVRAIQDSKDLISKGGGHKFAGGITMPTKNIDKFRTAVNDSYKKQELILAQQQKLLLPQADAVATFDEITEEFVGQIGQLEPFGIGNPQPILRSDDLIVKNSRKMGDASQHIKLELCDKNGRVMYFVAFNAVEIFSVAIGDYISVWFSPTINEWRNQRTVEGRLLNIEITE